MGKGEMRGEMEKDGDVRYSDGRFDWGCCRGAGTSSLKASGGVLACKQSITRTRCWLVDLIQNLTRLVRINIRDPHLSLVLFSREQMIMEKRRGRGKIKRRKKPNRVLAVVAQSLSVTVQI